MAIATKIAKGQMIADGKNRIDYDLDRQHIGADCFRAAAQMEGSGGRIFGESIRNLVRQHFVCGMGRVMGSS
ncbi:hypothetical protein ACFQI7_31515 [Paenibacillus allorhizosphaerae]|uniref:hypothetical protein n=1 Tax=Paenibacillus allorhizosphaerae TaxID=2849866 RepID=UPI001C405208|nr:hypothetical protein [Paenibacillus allorhizosphaerae]